MTKDQATQDEINTLKERLADVEGKVAAMQQLFGVWMDGQVQAGRQSMSRPAGQGGWPGPVDPQQAMIDARAKERAAVAKDRAPAASAGETYDAATSRINAKRREQLGEK